MLSGHQHNLLSRHNKTTHCKCLNEKLIEGDGVTTEFNIERVLMVIGCPSLHVLLNPCIQYGRRKEHFLGVRFVAESLVSLSHFGK